MYLDLSAAHRRFAAYTMDDWNTWYENWKSSAAGQDAIRGQQESTDWLKQTRGEDVGYRNAELAQRAAASRADNATSRANAQLNAKTQIKTTKMTIDASYRQFRERLNELEIPTLNLDIWKRQQDVALAKAALQLEARGPRNALQYSAAMGQANAGPNLPASLAAIARNEPAYVFEGQSGKPEAMTYDSLAKQYGFDGGGGANAGVAQSDVDRENAALKAIQMVADRGPQGQAPGSLESLTGYDREILASGLERLGYDYNDFIERYRRAGIGQSDPRAA